MPPGSLGTKLEHYETSYMEYLESARAKVQDCTNACQCWCYPYDGDSPTVEILLQSGESSAADSVASTPVVTPAIEINPFPGDATPTAESNTPVAEKSQESSPKPEQESSSKQPGKQETPNEAKEVGSMTAENKANVENTNKNTNQTDGDNVDKLPVIRDKVSHVKQDSCADSVISEADSALSGSSSNTETAHNEADQAGSRSDSPLNDDFGSQDFNAFLLSLKRVKTPVEFCDNMEDSIQEFEELLNSLKLNISSRTSTTETRGRSQSDGTSEELPKFVNSTESKDLVKPSAASTTESDTLKARPASIVSLTEFDKEISKKASVSDSVPAPVTPGPSQSKPNVNTPIKYSAGAPSIG